MTRTITVARGDGIGPEIMGAALSILHEAGAQFDVEFVEMGLSVYEQGNTSGITPEAWESMRRTRVLYKAPFTTTQGKGVKSINVTLRKSLGLFANIRPVMAYTPYIQSHHPDMNLVIIRENEEDLYAGIEHRQTYEVYQTLKLLSLPGSERIIRYAFEYARAHDRGKVTCMTKDNIMKLTDGMFHDMFNHIAGDYPDIETEHLIIDIGTARLASYPEQFEVVVVPNLYGDVLSDVSALLTGSVGLAGSANIGDSFAMFEAVHGSAPDIAGKGIANPSGLLLAGVLMLQYIGQAQVATRVQNAWLKTLEDGVHTIDIYNEEHSTQTVNTQEFAAAICDRLGQQPERLHAARAGSAFGLPEPGQIVKESRAQKALVGVDVFLDWDEADRNPDVLGEQLSAANGEGLNLIMITNRGQKVWPEGLPETFCTDHWRCRFQSEEPVSHAHIVRLLGRIEQHGFDFIKMEGLFTFDGEPGFSLGQGQ
ncbi:MAG: NADP-dependent isocitrate dehydrogenase [Anaerolineae bacterium]